jgi:hypothetical protein
MSPVCDKLFWVWISRSRQEWQISSIDQTIWLTLKRRRKRGASTHKIPFPAHPAPRDTLRVLYNKYVPGCSVDWEYFLMGLFLFFSFSSQSVCLLSQRFCRPRQFDHLFGMETFSLATNRSWNQNISRTRQIRKLIVYEILPHDNWDNSTRPKSARSPREICFEEISPKSAVGRTQWLSSCYSRQAPCF